MSIGELLSSHGLAFAGHSKPTANQKLVVLNAAFDFVSRRHDKDYPVGTIPCRSGNCYVRNNFGAILASPA